MTRIWHLSHTSKVNLRPHHVVGRKTVAKEHALSEGTLPLLSSKKMECQSENGPNLAQLLDFKRGPMAYFKLINAWKAHHSSVAPPLWTGSLYKSHQIKIQILQKYITVILWSFTWQFLSHLGSHIQALCSAGKQTLRGNRIESCRKRRHERPDAPVSLAVQVSSEYKGSITSEYLPWNRNYW